MVCPSQYSEVGFKRLEIWTSRKVMSKMKQYNFILKFVIFFSLFKSIPTFVFHKFNPSHQFILFSNTLSIQKIATSSSYEYSPSYLSVIRKSFGLLNSDNLGMLGFINNYNPLFITYSQNLLSKSSNFPPYLNNYQQVFKSNYPLDSQSLFNYDNSKRKLFSNDGKLLRSNTNLYCNNVSSTTSSNKSNGHLVSESEILPFQAKVSRVMDIIINSLYTDRDIFMRELVSNAADACDKKKLLANLHQDDILEGSSIRIKADKEKSLLIIEDDGIGMNKNEIIHNLGTIAQSGTSKFIEQLAENSADASSLIGQFGVGFYSAYLVADKVEVLSRRYGEDNSELILWQSDNGGNFTVSKIVSNDKLDELLKNGGTKITLHLKPDCDEYLEDYKIKELLRKYSEFIQFPIQLWSEKIEYERVPDTSSKDIKAGEKPKMKTITKKKYQWERINLQPPIWRRNENELKEDDYFEFYKTTFKSFDEPLGYTLFRVEGQVDFSSLLFVPGTIPWELSRSMFDEQSRGIRLYVKRIFINDKFSESIPRWLIFVRGVVDSEDLPLNVGREILQKSKMLSLINKQIVENCIKMFQKIKESGGLKWQKFTDNYGKYLKIGVVESTEYQDDIASLIEFYSTQSGTGTTDLEQYISRMQKNQTAIYYMAGDNKKAAFESPALEKLKQLGYEVLYCTEPVDEFCLSTLGMKKFKKFDVIDVTKQNIKISQPPENDNNEKIKLQKLELEGLCDWLSTFLGKRVEKVTVSERLTESPAILVQSDFGLSPTMQRYIKQQSVASGQSQSGDELMGMGMNKAILEINPDHYIVKHLKDLVDKDKESPIAEEIAQSIYDVASLQGGYPIENPNSFGRHVIELMTKRSTEYINNMVNIKSENKTT